MEHGAISGEDQLYARTIRTVHTLATSLFPLASILDLVLLELQFENGLEVKTADRSSLSQHTSISGT